jgi:hypothetical protein
VELRALAVTPLFVTQAAEPKWHHAARVAIQAAAPKWLHLAVQGVDRVVVLLAALKLLVHVDVAIPADLLAARKSLLVVQAAE